MPIKSTKVQEGATVQIKIGFDGGLNYSQSPSQIADNELTRAYNIVYNAHTGTPEVRPGTSCVTAAALPAAIRKIYYYEKSASEQYLIAVSGKKLYRLDTDHWHEIGTDALIDNVVVPSFLTFNTLLLIADGSTNLRQWNGTALTSLTDGLTATAITEIAGRVVINSANDPDLVTFSGVEDEAMWDTADATNPAIGIRAGFGDNMTVNALAVFGSDLIVSKKGSAEKRLYKINTADVPENWAVLKLSSNNASLTPHTMTGAFNNVFFADSDGFKTIKGVTEYGDLQIDPVGQKIGVISGCIEIKYIPMFNSIWLLTLNKIYTFSKTISAEAYTELDFDGVDITSVIQLNQSIYLAGSNGYLYQIDGTATTDELTPGVTAGYKSILRTKRFSFGNSGMILRKTSVAFKPITAPSGSTVVLRGILSNGTIIDIKSCPILKDDNQLYYSNEYLNDATTILGETSTNAWLETTYNRLRDNTIQFQIDSSVGRYGIEELRAEIALVGG